MVLKRRSRRGRGRKSARRGSPKYHRVVKAIAALKNNNGSSLKSVQKYMHTSRKATVRMMKRAMRARLVVRSNGRFKVSRHAKRPKRAGRRRRRRRAGRKTKRRRSRRTRRKRKSAKGKGKKRRSRRGRKQRRRRRRSSRRTKRRGRKSRRRSSRRRVRRAAPKPKVSTKLA